MTKILDVREAVGCVRDGSTVVIGGSGAGHALPQRFIDELAAVYAPRPATRATSPRSASWASAISRTAGSRSSACRA